jgi:uncharacterized membrane protein YkoI
VTPSVALAAMITLAAQPVAQSPAQPPGQSATRSDENAVSPSRARAALAAGLIRPMSAILSEVEARYLGKVIEIELQEQAGNWIYEFELLPDDGRLFILLLDAATGKVLHTRGPVKERP